MTTRLALIHFGMELLPNGINRSTSMIGVHRVLLVQLLQTMMHLNLLNLFGKVLNTLDLDMLSQTVMFMSLPNFTMQEILKSKRWQRMELQ